VSTMNSGLLKSTNILAFVLTVFVNGLAGGTTILGGKNTATISDSNPTLITPAGYVFSIWGVIYILLGAFVLYQALPRNEGKEFRSRIG
jgi:benzodiazapine receptor